MESWGRKVYNVRLNRDVNVENNLETGEMKEKTEASQLRTLLFVAARQSRRHVIRSLHVMCSISPLDGDFGVYRSFPDAG
jgi:hypothetical protein